jgi:DNA polymerase-3 subunit epsilon
VRTYSPEFLSTYRILSEKPYYIFDTETTGLRRPAEIVQFALIDYNRNIFINTLVKPVYPIPRDATAIHGITDEMVKNAPRWDEVKSQFLKVTTGEIVFSYNVVFDCQMMHLSDEAYRLPYTDYKAISRYFCAMEWYAELYGRWYDYRRSFTWQKLTDAIQQSNLEVNNAHSALGDALMTQALLEFHTTPDKRYQPPA